MKINIIQLNSDYRAMFWFNGITNRATELSYWVDSNNYCELCESEMTANCNNGGCDE